MNEMNGRILPADRPYRKRVLIGLFFLTLGVAACLLALLSAFREMETLAETDAMAAREKLRGTVTAACAANLLFSTASCAWFGVLAYRTLASGQYPPPGTRIFRDTRLRTGRGARVRAAWLVAAALIMMSTNVAMWYLHRIVESLQG